MSNCIDFVNDSHRVRFRADEIDVNKGRGTRKEEQ